VLLTNPHADGRLDGQWLSDGLATPSRSPHPVDFAELERAYSPVLALGFLTEHRRRTLPQAAMAFAFALGAVPSVRFRDLAQVEAFGNPDQVEPLTDAELGRLARG
jgi:aryl-alcohol dehydrogenase-like predicted oxidoreductase